MSRSARRNPNKAFTGWTLDIVPYLEQDHLRRQSDQAYAEAPDPFQLPHWSIMGATIPSLICPSDPRITHSQPKPKGYRVAFTSYLGVSGWDAERPNGFLSLDRKVRIAQISDGTSQTLALGERPPSGNLSYGWWYASTGSIFGGLGDIILGVRTRNYGFLDRAGDCPPGVYPFMSSKGFDDPCGRFHFWSPHAGGSHFAFADGSVRFLRYSVDPIFPALATVAGDEAVSVP